MYIHGGGWTTGSKSLTGPLLTEMVSHGWVVVSIDHRLTAKAGYPTQLIDCKRALRWIKDEIRIFGGNPNNVVVAGDSSGGHLAALLALTPNLPEFQPGFESADTSVKGCVALGASLDLTDLKNYSRHEARGRFVKDVAKRDGSAESAESKYSVMFLSAAALYDSNEVYSGKGPYMFAALCPSQTFRPQVFDGTLTPIQNH